MLSKLSHTLFRGWLISQTLGFASALKLLSNIFRPTASPAMAYSFGHMYQLSSLTIENKDTGDVENGLQIGYTLEEMASRLENPAMANSPVPMIVSNAAGSIG